ncbi:MAG: CRISPR system precrRNA processing endoribonuclease RAMP protein Cas6 [Chloroflexi bacterium]|nr:CRISPR system precrRNA processing endoribonuclease RAMP protein Cas6 [Chloroflexota bacterium]
MHHFTAHILHFHCQVQTPIVLNEHQGSAVRGALFHALRRQFCFNKEAHSCGECPLSATCPICFLMATRDQAGWRGVEVPRPYVVSVGDDAASATDSSSSVNYEPGQPFDFSLTLFAQALNLFPYVILAVRHLEEGGLGLRVNNGRRGTFRVQSIEAHNPLTGERQAVLGADGQPVAGLAAGNQIKVPDVPVTHEQVLQVASKLLHQEPLTIEFLTPTSLTDQKHALRQPAFRPLFQRLLERLSALARTFTDSPLELEFRALVDQAEAVGTLSDETRWVELESYSTRKGGRTPTSGFVGRATFQAADWAPFAPWLVWGQFTHVGKNTVKGNGQYRIEG